MTPLDRFNAKWVEDPDTGCWLWTTTRTAKGYGQIRVDGVCWYAHRWSYEYHVGPIPEGLEIDHVKERGCVNRHCVNPAHLEPVTHTQNLRRGISANALKTHCPQGHPYVEGNIYHRSDGGRDCRTCVISRSRSKVKLCA